MIAPPIGYPIGCLTGDPKGYPNRPRIARIESCRPLLKTRGAGSSISFSNPTRASRDAWMTGADAPQGWAA